MPSQPEVLEERMNNLIRENSKDHQVIINKIDNLCKKLDRHYLTKLEFRPYKVAMNIMGGAFLLAIIGALIQLVVVH